MNRFTAQQVWRIVADPKMITSTCGSDDDLGMSDDATRRYTGVRAKRAPLFWGPPRPDTASVIGTTDTHTTSNIGPWGNSNAGDHGM